MRTESPEKPLVYPCMNRRHCPGWGARSFSDIHKEDPPVASVSRSVGMQDRDNLSMGQPKWPKSWHPEWLPCLRKQRPPLFCIHPALDKGDLHGLCSRSSTGRGRGRGRMITVYNASHETREGVSNSSSLAPAHYLLVQEWWVLQSEGCCSRDADGRDT